MLDKIVIKGAREHNLKNFDLEIPKNRLIVITGLSGSGKSTLAFDTLYAEGQRRYVESLSAYARQFLNQMDKPDIDSIEGLSPSIAIEQKTVSKNPRSTVGTITEIYDYLRLLYSKASDVFCPSCGKRIQARTVQDISSEILSRYNSRKIKIYAPVIRGKKGEFKNEFIRLLSAGFSLVKVDQTEYYLDEQIVLDKNKKHDIDLLVDRLAVNLERKQRIIEACELAGSLGHGIIKIIHEDTEELFSQSFSCIDCNIGIPDLNPRVFSFNSPYGACPECHGLGYTASIDPDLVIPDRTLSLKEGAIKPFRRTEGIFYSSILRSLSKHIGFSLSESFDRLSESQQETILYGTGSRDINIEYQGANSVYITNKPFEGIINNLQRRYMETDSDYIKKEIENYMKKSPCRNCGGQRLKKEALSCRVFGLNIHEICSLSIDSIHKMFSENEFEGEKHLISEKIVKEIKNRLGFLKQVGLDYLTLNREAATLSGGEGQRIRLATQIGSGLTGVLYILDEPSIGLHKRDTERLFATLKELRDVGNTVVIVEHDDLIIKGSDHVVDLGPKAGKDGGHIIYSGEPSGLLKDQGLTGQYISGRKQIALPRKYRRQKKGLNLTVNGARQNNLKDISVDIPLGLLVCITGVSGSGKSTLLEDIIYRYLMKSIYNSRESIGKCDGIKGAENIERVINIDQSPIGRTPRSNPITYIEAFSAVRQLFSSVPASRERGYRPGRFSFNVKGGRCEKCQGAGRVKIEMHFLPDVFITCSQCNGRRYNSETLDIRYKGKNISEVLDMTVEEALTFFENIPHLKRKLSLLNKVGLDYITLGQPATTLSGGEAQRLKLTKELSKTPKGHTFYILDEPTIGLHPYDINKLLLVLQKLVDKGNTVVIIEHNMDIIKNADYIIDLGPEGGNRGGHLIAKGTPADVAREEKSYTGRFLKELLKKDK